MLRRRYASKENGKCEATVFVSGAAVFTHATELQESLNDALDACGHLVVDISAAGPIDLTLRALLCSLHRRSELMNKTMSVRVADAEGNGCGERYARVEGCLFKDADGYCSLWDGPGGR